jgi:hypothetical protein
MDHLSDDIAPSDFTGHDDPLSDVGHSVMRNIAILGSTSFLQSETQALRPLKPVANDSAQSIFHDLLTAQFHGQVNCQ